MGIETSAPPTSRARALDALLAPLLDLLEAASGARAALFVVLHEPACEARYAYARDGGLVETLLPARAATALPDHAGGLRAVAALRDAQGRVVGHLEAASLSGHPFGAPGQAALERCARVLELHLAAVAPAPAARTSPDGFALLDALTGLPNRTALLLEMERMLARAQRDDMAVFVVCVGLAGADAMRGAALERGIASLAACVADGVRGGDLVARTGDHEFVVAGSIPRMTAEASAAVVLERLSARCAAAVSASTQARVDMGFALARIGEFDALALLAEAEASLLR